MQVPDISRYQKKPSKITNERQLVLKEFLEHLNADRRPPYPPLTPARLGRLLSLIDTSHLKTFLGELKQSNHFSKSFWWRINPKNYMDQETQTTFEKMRTAFSDMQEKLRLLEVKVDHLATLFDNQRTLLVELRGNEAVKLHESMSGDIDRRFETRGSKEPRETSYDVEEKITHDTWKGL